MSVKGWIATIVLFISFVSITASFAGGFSWASLLWCYEATCIAIGVGIGFIGLIFVLVILPSSFDDFISWVKLRLNHTQPTRVDKE